MSKNFSIQTIKKIISKENTDYYWLTGYSTENFNIGTQPVLMSVLSEKNFSTAQVGDVIDLKDNKKDTDPYWIFPKEIGDPENMLGSDCNSGLVWYGKTNEIEKLIPEINKETETFIKLKGDSYINDSYFNVLNSPLIQWNFEDGNSILIFYVDCDESFPLQNIKYNENQIVSSMFGAYTDDIMLHEFFYTILGKTLKKIKIGDDDSELDSEEYEEYESYGEYLSGEKPNAKKIALINDFAYHLYCDLFQWHENENMSQEATILAKKLIKNNVIKNIMPPNINETTKLVCINDKSNKEYSLSLTENNGQFSVDASYGIIGKKMKIENKILTYDLLESKKVYTNLIKEKLAKGYELESTKELKNQNKI